MSETEPRPPRFRRPWPWPALRPSRQRLVELTVIVFGVLIALGLEQMVQEWRWKGEARELEALVREDLEANLVHAIERIAVDPCLRTRVILLATGLSDDAVAYAPQPHALTAPNQAAYALTPAYRAPMRIWRTASGDRLLSAEAAKRFSRVRILAYAEAFRYVDDVRTAQNAEGVAGGRLLPLALGVSQLTPEVRADLLADIGDLDTARTNTELLARRLVERGERLAVAPDQDVVQARLNDQRQIRGVCVDMENGMALSRRLTELAGRAGR